MIVTNLVYRPVDWSWGLISKTLPMALSPQVELQTKVFGEWQETGEENIVMSQNATQLPKIGSLQKTIARLGGNRSFDGSRAARLLELIGQCAAVIATNKKLLKLAQEVNKDCYLIPNGLDLDKWKAPANRKWRTKKIRVGFAGNVSTLDKRDYKGLDFVEEACEELGLPLARALYKENQIPHDQMLEKFWSQIDLLILPTRGEGCSNTIMESLSCSVPVITTETAGFHGEFLKHKHDVLFCKRSTESIIHQIETFINNPALQRSLRVNSRIFAEKYHDINQVAQAFADVFTKAYYCNDHFI